MSVSDPKSEILPAGQALPGRPEPIATAPAHAITGRPLTAATPDGLEEIILGMGCFWGVERLFWQIDGVWHTAVGYAGGHTPNPTYEEACSGRTGHAEVVRVVYDPAAIALDDVLKVFWEGHDPTQGMRQGNDRGTQYRSAIWYYTDEQEEAVRGSRRQHEKTLADGGGRGDASKIVTEIARAGENFVVSKAEEYHQQYLEKGGQDATVGSLAPIQCYGNRGPIKQMDKPKIREVLQAHEL